MVEHLTRREILCKTAAGVLAASVPTLVLAQSQDGFVELRAQKTSLRLAGEQSPASNLWLYNRQSPGPEIRVTQGERVRVRFINELDEPTSIHWHGIRIANEMDGVSGLTQEPVKPGETFDYDFVAPDAGTFWYHAHNKSWEQVTRGLYGTLIVDEQKPLVDRQHDLTLVIDDWRLGNDGTLHVASLGNLGDWSHAGRLGNWLTVNGRSQPSFRLNKGQTYRLRLINVCNARILQIDPAALGAKIIGYDGFLFPEAREAQGRALSMMPAQRIDLLVTPTSATMQTLNDVGDFALQEMSGQSPLSMALFKVVEGAGQPNVTSIELTPNQIAEPDMGSALEVSLVMQGGAMGRMGQMVHQGKVLQRGDMRRTKQFWAFNGVANVADKPLFSAKTGQSVVLTTDNQTGWPHGIHLHGHHFQIIEHNGEAPKHIDWRDTFTIDRDETVKIAFVADNPGKWLLHCHMLEHAAAGMNTWFEVT